MSLGTSLCECLTGYTAKCNKLQWGKVVALHQLVTTQVIKNKGRNFLLSDSRNIGYHLNYM